jgi:hypothetical protein
MSCAWCGSFVLKGPPPYQLKPTGPGQGTITALFLELSSPQFWAPSPRLLEQERISGLEVCKVGCAVPWHWSLCMCVCA